MDSVCYDFFGNIFAKLLSTLDCNPELATGVTCQALEGNHNLSLMAPDRKICKISVFKNL